MSRSRRKTPVFAITTCRSERQDKKLWHKRWRTSERTTLSSASPEALSAHQPLVENEVINVWAMGKDGHRYCSARTQAESAQFFADRKGRNPHERASLNARALHKWMSK